MSHIPRSIPHTYVSQKPSQASHYISLFIFLWLFFFHLSSFWCYVKRWHHSRGLPCGSISGCSPPLSVLAQCEVSHILIHQLARNQSVSSHGNYKRENEMGKAVQKPKVKDSLPTLGPRFNLETICAMMPVDTGNFTVFWVIFDLSTISGMNNALKEY